MSSKKQLLDPIGTLCRMVALNFTEHSTKISIHNHVLTLHRPDGLQWAIRFYNGDERDNISELYYAITRIVKWFVIPQYKEIKKSFPKRKIVEPENSFLDEEDELIKELEKMTKSVKDSKIEEIEEIESIEEIGENLINNNIEIASSEEIRRMIKYLCLGFKKLQKTYRFGNVVLAIQFYVNILMDSLNGIFTEDKLPNFEEMGQTYDNLLDYNKLKNLWDINRFKRICELYDKCFETLEDNDFPDDKKSQYIDGYLKSINTILDITDHEFQKLIQSSNEG